MKNYITNLIENQVYAFYAYDAKPTDTYLDDFKIFEDNTTTGSEVYIGYDKTKKQIVISYRGSDNWRNWVEDFK